MNHGAAAPSTAPETESHLTRINAETADDGDWSFTLATSVEESTPSRSEAQAEALTQICTETADGILIRVNPRESASKVLP